MRRSITARTIGEMLILLSPSRIAELPEHLGRTTRRIYVKSADRKEFAAGVYRSVKEPPTYHLLCLWAPAGYVLRKTATRPARAMGASLSAGWHAFVHKVDSFWSSIPSAWDVLAAPVRWWNRLLDAADSSLQRTPSEESLQAKHAWSSSKWTEQASGERRPAAWTFVAITGVVGVILAFILQFSGQQPTTLASDKKVATRAARKKMDVPLGVLAMTEELRFHHRPPPPAPREPLPIPAPEEPRMELAQSETLAPLPPVPELDVKWITLRREHTVAAEPESEQFLVQSERPEIETESRPNDDDWNRFHVTAPRDESLAAVSYERRLHPIDRERVESELVRNYLPESAPEGDSDVRLSIEKRLPRESQTGEAASWELVVRNDGRKTIDQLHVEDLIPDPRSVVDVSPLGIIRDGMVHWAMGPLKPGDERVLSVRMSNDMEGRVVTTSRVRSFAAVSFRTDVSGPKLALEVESPTSLQMDEPCRIRYLIRNTGEAIAENVVLREELPVELEHSEGRRLDHVVGAIPPGETREAQLTVYATAPGSAQHLARLLNNGKVYDEVEKRVEIAQREAPKTIARQTPRPMVRKPRPSPPPAEICRPIFANPDCVPYYR